MFYPVFCKQDEHGHFCISTPDLPGCFTDADTEDLAFDRAKQAVECSLIGYFADSETPPAGSSIADHLNDPDYHGGTWGAVYADLDQLCNEAAEMVATADAYQNQDAYA